MAVNKEAVKYSSASSGSVSTGEMQVAEQVEDAMAGCGMIAAFILLNMGGAALCEIGNLGNESSLKLVGGAILVANNLCALALSWDKIIAKFHPKNKKDNSSQ